MTKQATQERIGNVLSWFIWTPSSLAQGHSTYSPPQKLSWTGLDSPSWWNNVGNLPWYRQQTDNLGNTWEIDFLTNQVTLNK